MARMGNRSIQHVTRMFVLALLLCMECVLVSISGAEGANISCVERERQALLRFKQDLIDEYGVLASWGSEEGKKDCCKWRGVGCDNITGHVTLLDLHSTTLNMGGYSIRLALEGKIPDSMGSLSRLGTLSLHNNNFSGDLPVSLKNCSELKFMDLSENGFSGKIPAWIGESLSSLKFLSLQSNEFYGNLPAQLCRLAFLRILDLSLNNISESIPKCLNNLTAMLGTGESNNVIDNEFTFSVTHNDVGVLVRGQRYVNKAWLGWKGRKYEYAKNLGLLKILDLAGNQLTGEIPEEMTRLSGLVALNLSRNNLTGVIPQMIGQLSQLQALDFSGNMLSGTIPVSMADLSFLSYLNLSHNQLSGKIPSGTQLQSFDASTFASNLALCGSPVDQKCPVPPSPPSNNNKQHKEENFDEFMKWFYAGMGIGTGASFWGLVAALLLNRSWRYAYFQCLDKLWLWLQVTIAVFKRRLEEKCFG